MEIYGRNFFFFETYIPDWRVTVLNLILISDLRELGSGKINMPFFPH